jgi:hypothetical protein
VRHLIASLLLLALLAQLAPALVAAETEDPAAADAPEVSEAAESEGIEDLDAAVREILERPVEDEEVDSNRCINRAQISRTIVLDERRIAFVLRGGNEIWLNQLRTRCPGLRDGMALEIQGGTSMRLCRMDSIAGIDMSMARMRVDPRITGTCLLGDFERISEDQLSLLREALQEERRRR